MNKKLSVLIVDDDISLGDSLTDILDAKGYDVNVVTSGKEALATIDENDFDVIFMDIRMPGMNGVETFMEVKKKSPHTSVVMITAFADGDLITQARDEGALQILPKPLDLEKIIGFLQKQELLRTIFIVDDDITFCNSLKDAIELHSYNVTVVNSAQEAIDTFEQQNYGIVLLDLKLNGKSGMDVAEDIKQKGFKCVMVMMSAFKKEFQKELDNSDQKFNFMEKPFEIDDLLQLLNEVSKKRLMKVLV